MASSEAMKAGFWCSGSWLTAFIALRFYGGGASLRRVVGVALASRWRRVVLLAGVALRRSRTARC
jgi:hypothetical protein